MLVYLDRRAPTGTRAILGMCCLSIGGFEGIEGLGRRPWLPVVFKISAIFKFESGVCCTGISFIVLIILQTDQSCLRGRLTGYRLMSFLLEAYFL